MQKRIFITGIAGFIGMHLALHLKRRGDYVVGCDNFNDYYDPFLKRQREEVLKKENISTLFCDIRDRKTLESVFAQDAITHVVHLAAQAGVRYSLLHPEKYVESNLDGFVQVLEAVRAYPHIKLTYASSSSVYGLNQKVPFSEGDATDLPASLYGSTKKSNELMAHAYHHLYGIAVTGLRFFTVYGPYGRPDMAYYSFTKSILQEERISLFHEGLMQRDFTYIDDIVSGIAKAIDKECPCEIFNLGNNQPQTVLSLVAIIEKHLNKKAKIEHLPKPPGDVMITYADISKSQKILGYFPTTSLEEGMQKFIQWYQRAAVKKPLAALQ